MRDGGLTEDRCQAPRMERPQKATLEEVFQAAYLDYCHYYDPETGAKCGLDRIMDYIVMIREGENHAVTA